MKLFFHCPFVLALIFGVESVVRGEPPTPPVSAPAELPSEVAVWEKKKADDFLARQKYASAYSAYEEAGKLALKCDDLAAYCLLQMGRCRQLEKRSSDASSLWSRLRGQYPKSPYAPQSLLLEGEDPTNKGKLDRCYDEILTKYPQSEEAATVLQKRGQAAFDKKDYAKATEWWGRFASDFPDHKQLAQVQAKLDSSKLVVGGDKTASGEAECASLLQRANALYDKASYREAAPLYQEVVTKYALNKEASQAGGRLARCLQALGRDQEALQILLRMVEKNPEGAAQSLGEIVLHAANRKMDPLRLQATQQLLEKYPDSFEAQQALFVAGLHAKRSNNRVDAEKTWTSLLAKYPETPFRAAVERELGQTQEKKNQEKAESVAKEELLKQAVETRKCWEKQATDFESRYRDVQASRDERAESAYQWGERCFFLEQFEKAIQQYQRVWEEFPESRRADESAFRAGQAWLCSGQTQKAEEQFLFLMDRFPQSVYRPLCLFCLGNRKILYEGNLDKAWEFFDRLLKEYPQDVLATRARTLWAGVKKLTKQELKDQVTRILSERQQAMKGRVSR